MYIILIKDGYYISLYTYGEFAKTYDTQEEAEEAIKKYIAEQEVYAKAEDQPKKRFF